MNGKIPAERNRLNNKVIINNTRIDVGVKSNLYILSPIIAGTPVTIIIPRRYPATSPQFK